MKTETWVIIGAVALVAVVALVWYNAQQSAATSSTIGGVVNNLLATGSNSTFGAGNTTSGNFFGLPNGGQLAL
jgi:hypothetical protein